LIFDFLGQIMFRKLFLSAAIFGAATASAFAADLPSEKGPPVYAPPPPPVFSWSGFYVGVNAGGIFNHASSDGSTLPSPAAFGAPDFSQSRSSTGFIGGGQIGYNYQVSQFVMGIEADFDGTTLHGGSDLFGIGDPTYHNLDSQRFDFFGTVRGRIGYAFDRVLVYATGGLAYARVNSTSETFYAPGDSFTYLGSASSVRTGYTVGGGIEYAIDNHWSIRGEGLYYNLGSQSYLGDPLAANPPFAVAHRVHTSGEIARAAVNYKFDMFAPPTPVVAKY
jgi:outer membrane immunogenic protein